MRIQLHLDCRIFSSSDNHTVHRMKDYSCDWAAMTTERAAFRWSWDQFRRVLLTVRCDPIVSFFS